MGIVADTNASKIVFDGSKAKVVMETVSNMFLCTLPQFEIFYTYKFDESVDNIKIPRFKELWDIGIVQNVLYDKLHYGYDDGFTAEVEFTKPALDVAQTVHKPFLHGPVEMLPPGVRTTHENPKNITPIRQTWYTACGIGEQVVPDSAAYRCGIRPLDSLYVDVLDQPRFGTRLRREYRGGLIKHAYRILEFKNWLIAKNKENTVVLAHMDSFSLACWMDTTSSPELSIDAPDYDAGFYTQKGRIKKIEKSKSPSLPTIEIISGTSVNTPLLDGETANDRVYAWYTKNSLFPE